MKDKLILSQIPIDELKEFIKQVVVESNEELIKKVLKEIPQEEVFTFEELTEFIKRTGPCARDAIVGYNIIPHTYDENANPHYLKSEVVNAIKSGPPARWFRTKRDKYLNRMNKEHPH